MGTSCAVEEMPDAPEQYSLIHPRAALLVQYVGSGYTERGPGAQERRVEIDVHVVGRFIGGDHSVYTYIDGVLSGLHGFRVSSPAGRMYPVRDRLVARDTDRWQYAVTFAFIAPHAG